MSRRRFSRRATLLAPVVLGSRWNAAGGSGALGVVLSTGQAAAEGASWPSRPVQLVVPFAPGGSTDLVARLVSQSLGERLGQPIVVENRPGAGATVGSAMVAAAEPDGYTLLMSNVASHGVAPALYTNLRYDPVRDFTHIGLINSNPSVFVANPDFPGRTLPDVVRISNADAGGLDAASSGSGSSNHLLIVQFAQVTGAHLNHVPYRGAGPAMTDVIAGVVPMMSDSLPSSAGHIRAGSVRAIAAAAAERHPAFPEVPTFREQGVDLVSTSWFGLSGPAGMADAVVAKLSQNLGAVLASPAIRNRFAELGGEAGQLSPGEYAAFVRAEVAHWAPLVRASGARVG